MIKKRYIFIPLIALTIGVIVIGTLGYILFFRNAKDTPLAKTDAGEPIGVPSVRSIGPEGGSISSQDGRFSVTIPQGAIMKPLDVSIQPITDKSPGGLGHGYRVAPDGVVFDVPVTVRFTFDDRDWPGELSDDMGIAFQANDGTWQTFNSVMRDQTSRSITVSTTHFTDYTAVYPYKLVPISARVHVGEKLGLALYYCGRRRSAIDNLVSLTEQCVQSDGRHNVYNWSVNGVVNGNAVVGTAYKGNQDTVSGGTYVAPAKRPNPSTVIVRGDVMFTYFSREPSAWVYADIEILGTGYMATGTEGDIIFSGQVCSLEEPFTVFGSPMNSKVNFKPSSAIEGTYTTTQSGYGATATSHGTYKIIGAETDNPRIAFTGSGTATGPPGTVTGSGTGFSIHLIPLTGDECSGGQ